MERTLVQQVLKYPDGTEDIINYKNDIMEETTGKEEVELSEVTSTAEETVETPEVAEEATPAETAE
jgi:hypothetical protein